MMMRRFRQSMAAKREPRWHVRRESEDDEREPKRIILGMDRRDNAASQAQADREVRSIIP